MAADHIEEIVRGALACLLAERDAFLDKAAREYPDYLEGLRRGLLLPDRRPRFAAAKKLVILKEE